MATAPAPRPAKEIDYPTSDGRPMAETEVHRDLMLDSIQTLQRWFAADPMVCVSGNLLVHYEEGNRRRHVAPDVFVAKGVPKKVRDYFLVWEEPKGPHAVIELTSSSTRKEDLVTKKALYQDTLRVPEYFLFDPKGDYLQPALQGFRLQGGDYVRIESVNGRLPSEVLGLHLEQDGSQLRFWNPATGKWLPTPKEVTEQLEEKSREKDEAIHQKDEVIHQKDEILRQKDASLRQQAEALHREELLRQQEADAKKKAEEEVAALRAKLAAIQQGQKPPAG